MAVWDVFARWVAVFLAGAAHRTCPSSFCVASAALETCRVACFLRIALSGLCQVATRYKFRGKLHTPHFTLHTPHSTVYTLHFTLYTLHFTLYTPHSKLYTPHFTLFHNHHNHHNHHNRHNHQHHTSTHTPLHISTYRWTSWPANKSASPPPPAPLAGHRVRKVRCRRRSFPRPAQPPSECAT